MLLPHIDALASHAPSDAGTETTTSLLNQAGVFARRPWPGRARTRVQARPGDPGARGNLAVADEAARDLGRAIPLMPG